MHHALGDLMAFAPDIKEMAVKIEMRTHYRREIREAPIDQEFKCCYAIKRETHCEHR